MAWLAAVPNAANDKRSRYTQLIDSGVEEVPMPEIGNAGYLVELLNEVGIVETNGMGMIPISWSEIDSWLSISGRSLSTWEALTIRELSSAYATEFAQASSPNKEAPWEAEEVDVEIKRSVVADKMKSFLSAFKKE